MERSRKSLKTSEHSNLSPEEVCELKWKRWKAYLNAVLWYKRKKTHLSELNDKEKSVVEEWSEHFFLGDSLKQKSLSKEGSFLVPVTSYLDCFKRISECHVRKSPTGRVEHLDFAGTLAAATDGHVWPMAEDEVKEYLNLCVQCQGTLRFEVFSNMPYEKNLPACFTDTSLGSVLFSGEVKRVNAPGSTVPTPAHPGKHPLPSHGRQTGGVKHKAKRPKSEKAHKSVKKVVKNAKKTFVRVEGGRAKRGRPKKNADVEHSDGNSGNRTVEGGIVRPDSDQDFLNESAARIPEKGQKSVTSEDKIVSCPFCTFTCDVQPSARYLAHVERCRSSGSGSKIKFFDTTISGDRRKDFPWIYMHLCEICCNLLSSGASLEYHLSKMHNIQLPQFPSNKLSRSKTPLEPFLPCGSCDDRFWSGQGLSVHQEYYHGPEPAALVPDVCRFCKRSQGGRTMLHVLKHHADFVDMFLSKYCPACDATLSCRRAFEHHMLTVHRDLFPNRQVMYRYLFSQVLADGGKEEDPLRDLAEPIELLKSMKPAEIFWPLPSENVLELRSWRNFPLPDDIEQPEESSLYAEESECPRCKCEFSIFAKMSKHFYFYHRWECPKCDKVFLCPKERADHLALHGPNDPDIDRQKAGGRVALSTWAPRGERPP